MSSCDAGKRSNFSRRNPKQQTAVPNYPLIESDWPEGCTVEPSAFWTLDLLPTLNCLLCATHHTTKPHPVPNQTNLTDIVHQLTSLPSTAMFVRAVSMVSVLMCVAHRAAGFTGISGFRAAGSAVNSQQHQHPSQKVPSRRQREYRQTSRMSSTVPPQSDRQPNIPGGDFDRWAVCSYRY